jgi:malate dehydrogenase
LLKGNHSATQYPDFHHAHIQNFPSLGLKSPALTAVNDDKWLQQDFIASVQQRGAEVIKARKLSSAASAAHAIVDHLKDWLVGTKAVEWNFFFFFFARMKLNFFFCHCCFSSKGEIVSMGIVSEGWYGIPRGIVFSFPVTCAEGKWHVVEGLPVNAFSREKLDITTKELLEERDDANQFLSS